MDALTDCSAHLERAAERLSAACLAFERLGLHWNAAECAERLRDPDRAAALCAEAERACLAATPDLASCAIAGADALAEGAFALRSALECAASSLNVQAKAFGAYQANA
jgi:hypothetical protein